MRRPVALTYDQAHAARALIEAFEENGFGARRAFIEAMTEDYAIPDPEAALNDLRTALEN